MTNEEKALELLPDIPTLIPLCAGVREKLVEMAEWKDQQLKEYLEKKKVEMKEKHDSCNSAILKISNSGGILTIDEIINELFGE